MMGLRQGQDAPRENPTDSLFPTTVIYRWRWQRRQRAALRKGRKGQRHRRLVGSGAYFFSSLLADQRDGSV